MKNFLKSDTIIWIVLVVIIFSCNLFLPKSGKLVLLDELFDILIIWVGCIYVIVKLITIKKSILYTNKVVGVITIILCLVVGSFFTKDIILDVFSSPIEVELHNIELYQYHKRTVHHYYVKGQDENGNIHNFEISSKDYSDISKLDKNNLEIEYYKNTERVISYSFN